MFRRMAVSGLAVVFSFATIAARAENTSQPPKPGAEMPAQPAQPVTEKPGPTTKELLTDAAIIALIIAASIAAYKAMGRPCACPDDTMRNGRRCGNHSAYVKASGYKPVCYPTDITAAMVAAYRATKAIPGLR